MFAHNTEEVIESAEYGKAVFHADDDRLLLKAGQQPGKPEHGVVIIFHQSNLGMVTKQACF